MPGCRILERKARSGARAQHVSLLVQRAARHIPQKQPALCAGTLPACSKNESRGVDFPQVG